MSIQFYNFILHILTKWLMKVKETSCVCVSKNLGTLSVCVYYKEEKLLLKLQ
jgi:hypothetical protein